MSYKVLAYARVRIGCADILSCATRADATAKCAELEALGFIARFELVDDDGRAANFGYRSVEVPF